MARNSYKRKSNGDYSDYNFIGGRRYTRGKDRETFERKAYLKDEDDGYHFHIDLNLSKELFGKVGHVAKKLVGGILDYVDSDGKYSDRDREERYIGSNGYPERKRRR